MIRARNPLLPGCHPDPSVCRRGDTYYLVTSTFEYLPGLPIHASRDLASWELVGHAIHRPGQLDFRGIDSSSGLYAPTIRVVGDRLVVVCTVVGAEDGSWPGRTGHFLVTARDAAGPWSDPVWIDGVGGFDPSITVDGDRIWLCGTRETEPSAWRGQTEVWVAELDLETGALRSEPQTIWTGAAAHAVWAEGPHLVPRPGGGWMLVAAEGGTDLDHAVCVAYADEITGPYTGDPGNPRLTHRDLGAGVVAVGHADLVDGPDGRTWATVLALHPVREREGAPGRRGLLGRRTSLVPVAWEDGRPLFAPGSGRVAPWVEVPGEGNRAAETDAETTVRDDFDGAALDLAWNGVGRHPSAFADLAARPSHVRLAAGAEPTSRGAISFLGRRLPSERSAVEAVLELDAGDAPLRGGLLLRTSERAQLEVSVDRAGDARVRLIADGAASELARARVDPARPVTLRLEVDDLTARIRVAGAQVATTDAGALAPAPPRGFVGAWIGPFAVGEGHVDVDAVTVTAAG